ncbi:MAG: RES family NAD+ phosphorylase [Gammaproteobacteria bacterium]|nr:RES family NAD+ phosphorylase [Gammaproteobacteria bacterium]
MTAQKWWVHREECWQRSTRIIPSCYPPINLFEEVADAADFEAIYFVESLTNPRLRDQVGNIQLIPTADRIYGAGTSPIMAAFTHPNPEGSRFSDGSYGVYYAASDENTAIAETVYHRERLMSYQDVGPQEIAMRCYVGKVEGEFVDIRGLQQKKPDLYDPVSYAKSSVFGVARRKGNDWGILYNSVRHADGQCAAVFRPPVCKPVKQTKHYLYYWNGKSIHHIAEISAVTL